MTTTTDTTTAATTTMTSTAGAVSARAAVQHQYATPPPISMESISIPAPGPGQVLVKSRAAGINPVDLKTAEGSGIAGMLPADTLAGGLILGWDLAGEVMAVGEGVDTYAPGDRVFGLIAFPALGRTFADHVLVNATDLAPIPDGVSDVVAGAIPLVALTARQALIHTAKLQAGQTLLLHGGTGGVGHMAIQLAKAAGAHVIVTASAANRDLLKDLGADEVFDYRSERFEDRVHDVDVVFTTVDGDVTDRSWSVLKPGGVIVSITGTPEPPADAPEGARGAFVFVHADGDDVATIAGQLASGEVTPHIQRSASLEELPSLYAELEGGHVIGKLVVTF